MHSDDQFMALEKIKYPLVNQFYKRVYKKGIAGKNEAVFIIKNSQQIICSAKLKNIEQHLLLTGVACDKDFQQQGYATALIKQLLSQQQAPVFCFPYAHLDDFYQRLGFEHLAIQQAPAAIEQRFLRYQQQRDLRLMIYK